MGKLKRKISELDGFNTESGTKEHVTNEKLINIKQKFVENFIYDFTDEELAAKHTLETIFNKFHSFGYTYKCIKDALDLDPAQIGYFVKAIAAVADLELIKLSGSHNLFDPNYNDSINDDNVKNTLNDTPTEYEMESQSKYELFYQKDSNVYQLFDSLLCKLVQDIDLPIDSDTNYKINDVDWYVNQLEFGFLSKLLPFGNQFIHILLEISKSNIITNLTRFNQLSNNLIYILQRGESIISHWVTKILNKSETSGTSLFDPDELEWQQLNNRNCMDVLIKLFDIGESIHNDIQCFKNAKDKLKILEKLENECIAYKRRLDIERMKKLNAKRNAVNFILERKDEFDSLSLNSKMKHPFYIIGQDVRTSSVSSLKKLSKKLKSLLHPDTETDSTWKEKCEKSFKEASAALDLCMIMVKNPGKLSLCANGPLLDLNKLYNDSNVKNDNNHTNDTINASPFNVSFMVLPDFTVECIDKKIGTLRITVDTSMVSQKIFTGNTFFNILIHRPVHGDEPITLIPTIDKLSFWKKVDMFFTSTCHITIVDAVQPINLGSLKKYFVGVQIGGKNGSSLIKWKGVYIELDKKGRNITQIETLLSTFDGAPFVSNEHVKIVNSLKGNKQMMEKYLNECIDSAQTWANKI